MNGVGVHSDCRDEYLILQNGEVITTSVHEVNGFEFYGVLEDIIRLRLFEWLQVYFFIFLNANGLTTTQKEKESAWIQVILVLIKVDIGTKMNHLY